MATEVSSSCRHVVGFFDAKWLFAQPLGGIGGLAGKLPVGISRLIRGRDAVNARFCRHTLFIDYRDNESDQNNPLHFHRLVFRVCSGPYSSWLCQ